MKKKYKKLFINSLKVFIYSLLIFGVYLLFFEGFNEYYSYQLSGKTVIYVNPIIDELKDDVLKKMRDVKTSNFIDNKSLILRVLILGGLSFSILFLSYINVDFKGEIQQIIIEPINEIGLRGNVQEAVYMNISVTEGNLSDILGNNSIAKFKKENIKLTINPLLSETDPSDIRQVQAESFTPPDFPKEIYTSYDVSYNEKVAKQNQQVVKDYFEKINR